MKVMLILALMVVAVYAGTAWVDVNATVDETKDAVIKNLVNHGAEYEVEEMPAGGYEPRRVIITHTTNRDLSDIVDCIDADDLKSSAILYGLNETSKVTVSTLFMICPTIGHPEKTRIYCGNTFSVFRTGKKRIDLRYNPLIDVGMLSDYAYLNKNGNMVITVEDEHGGKRSWVIENGGIQEYIPEESKKK